MALPVTAGLAIDLTAKAYTGTLSDGATVTTWSDVSGNANHAVVTATSRANPQFRTGLTPNGGDAIRLQGAKLSFTNQSIFASSTSAEMHAVVRNVNGSTVQGFYQFGGGNWTNYPWSDGNIYDGSFTNTRFSYPLAASDEYHIYSVYHDGTQRVAMIDGRVIHTATVAFQDPHTTTFQPTLVLGDIAPGQTWEGDCAEFVVYTRSLTGTERSSVLNYLRQQHLTSPTALPVTTGLAIDLTAKSLEGHLDSGASLAVWRDQSGNANDATVILGPGGSNPTFYQYQTPNFGPAVYINGATLKFADQSVYAGASSGEVFIVVLDSGRGNPGPYQFGGNDWTYMPWSDGSVYDGSFTNSRYSFPWPSPGDFHVYNVSHDGTTRVTRIDGDIVHSVATAFVNPTNATYGVLQLGNLTSAPWSGEIAEFVAYNRSLSSAERATVLTFLQRQFMVEFADPNLDVPPVQSLLRVRSATLSSPGPAQTSVPALKAALAVHGNFAISGDQLVAAPPLTGTLRMSGALVTATLTLTSPADGDIVEITRPSLVVALVADDQSAVYTIEVQYAATSDFSTATTISGNATAVDGGVFLTPTSDVTADTYWRARLLHNGGVELDWSPALHFTLDTELGASQLSVTWTIGAAAKAIHLWHLDPSAAAPGDTVTAYGHGFPGTGRVLLAGTPCPVTRWALQPAVIESITADRQIDNDQVDPEHWEIDFVVPDVPPPGGLLEVTS